MKSARFLALLLVGCCMVMGQSNTEPTEPTTTGPTTTEPTEPDECMQPGLMCSNDCRRVLRCIPNRSPLRGFNMITVADCSGINDTFCDKDLFVCKSPKNCGTTSSKFACNDTGSYPNPLKCNTHHTCIVGDDKDNPTIVFQKCANGYAYDPLSGSCIFNLDHDVCTKGPVPKCNGPSMGAVALNPSIYYICIHSGDEWSHMFFRCPHGYFDNDLGYCVDTKDNGTNPPPNYICPGTGLFDCPGDCYSYYYCTAKLEAGIKRTCNTGYYFKQSLQKCVPGKCTNAIN